MRAVRSDIAIEAASVAGAAIATSVVISIFLRDVNEVTVASSLALAALVTYVVATVLSTRIRHRQARALIQAVLKKDVGLRTALDEPTWIMGLRTVGTMNPKVSTASNDAIAQIMARRAFSEVDVAALVHPLPKSATLRAAVLLDGDPMDA